MLAAQLSIVIGSGNDGITAVASGSKCNNGDSDDIEGMSPWALICIFAAVLMAAAMIWLVFFAKGSAAAGLSQPTPALADQDTL